MIFWSTLYTPSLMAGGVFVYEKQAKDRFLVFLPQAGDSNMLPMVKKTSPRIQASMAKYVTALDDVSNNAIQEYVNLSRKIQSIVDEYRHQRTELQKPKSGWIQPVPVMCGDNNCVECPHRVVWKISYYNPHMRPKGRFLAEPFTVDRSTIRFAGNSDALKQIDEILAVKKKIDGLIDRRNNIRMSFKSAIMRLEKFK